MHLLLLSLDGTPLPFLLHRVLGWGDRHGMALSGGCSKPHLCLSFIQRLYIINFDINLNK